MAVEKKRVLDCFSHRCCEVGASWSFQGRVGAVPEALTRTGIQAPFVLISHSKPFPQQYRRNSAPLPCQTQLPPMQPATVHLSPHVHVRHTKGYGKNRTTRQFPPTCMIFTYSREELRHRRLLIEIKLKVGAW
jgi:hypothetical protein